MGKYLTIIFLILLFIAYQLGVMKGESSIKEIYINEHFIVKKVLQELKLETITLHVKGNGQLFITGELTQKEHKLLENALITEFSNYTKNQLIQTIKIKSLEQEDGE